MAIRYHFYQLLLSLTVFSCFPILAAANEEMPVIAYWGVPGTESSEQCFRDFSECGFTASIYPYSSLNQLVKACRMAETYGIGIIGSCPEMVSDPVSTAQVMKNTKGFWGYLIQDEPNVPDIHLRQKEIDILKKTDKGHLFYINLFPCYHKERVKSAVKANSYPEYLQVASKTSCQQLSFDYYPITTHGIRPTWYYNLEMVRQESLASGKPFWGFVLCTPHDVPYDEGNFYPTPTLASLRLQVYSNLAYGAQAIQYFTYWTPDGRNSFHFHDGPIGLDGKKTKTYSLVQQMNRELRNISKLFHGAKVFSVHHLGTIPEGTTRQSTRPLNIRSLKIKGRKGAIISQLVKDGHQYLSIVNKDHERNMTVKIKAQNSFPCQINKNLQEVNLQASYVVMPGDLLLFKLK